MSSGRFLGEAHQLDCAVPRAGEERIFRDGAPCHGKRLSLVFMKVHDGKVPHAEVEELDRAIATCHDELVLIDLGPGEVILRVVCVEAAKARVSGWTNPVEVDERTSARPRCPAR